MKKNVIKFVGFWGVGMRNSYNSNDIKSIKFLQKFLKNVEQHSKKSTEFTFILADNHGKANGMNQENSTRYIEDIYKLLTQHNFKVILLSHLWKKWEISEEKINKIQQNKEIKKKWKNYIKQHPSLLKNALKHNTKKTPEEAALFYCIMRDLEKVIFENDFSEYIFHTYSNSELKDILPNLPTLYMKSRKGWIGAPWFTK